MVAFSKKIERRLTMEFSPFFKKHPLLRDVEDESDVGNEKEDKPSCGECEVGSREENSVNH